MSRSAVDHLVYLLDEAFEGKEQGWHSVLGNLASVTGDDWLWVPPDGVRSIRTLVAHVGGSLWLYYDRAFGNCEKFGNPILSWDAHIDELGVGAEELQGPTRLANEPAMRDVVAWATARFRAFRDAVSTLDDEGLLQERPTHWGQPRPVRWFAGVMIQHCSYHAGEINHIRALHQGND
jgi:DinB superfamily